MPFPATGFEAAGSGDAEAIAAMARTIWEQHYLPDILTGPELEFFWQRAERFSQVS